jgi:hypothetical protein
MANYQAERQVSVKIMQAVKSGQILSGCNPTGLKQREPDRNASFT